MPDKKKVSRLEQMRIDGVDPESPECQAAYLVSYLWDVGPTQAGGMGPAPLSHGEIAAWQDNTGIELTSWEARTLRSLSLAYLGESDRAKEVACPPPWISVPSSEDRELLPKLVKSVLRG